MKIKLNETQWELVGIFGKLLLDLIFGTARGRVTGLEHARSPMRSGQFIAAIWHSRILMLSYLFKGWNATAMVSRSEDGEIIARVVQRQGYETVRGSSSRGGLRALTTMIRHLRAGRTAIIIPDGPTGPRFRVKSGVITLAKKTGLPILPMTYSAERAKIFASWDRFVLPYPFTRCRVIFGKPLTVPPDADADAEEACRVRLEAELNRITAEADRVFGHPSL
ncbi:hypothetical protein DENIS_1008 [Desulfonema ishimotonii]|uniref:DUF374 domain-containing protein n=1 Tax=Desulfonema ishimotonii TaxID=45657 RepID=A0A401FSY1_9BACT|nr:lysophospholipid acyltransferase family protein [Desulfonema ishimotonii]GBC60066.1 hypothetical protein DENIS_1008 [Desulfonema ishimotonii]